MSARTGRGWPARLVGLGALLFLVGMALAYVTRDDPSPVAALASIAIGNLLVILGSAWNVRVESDPGDLVQDASGRLPSPAWWYPVGAAGLVDILAAPAVSGWLGVAGVLLVAAASVGAGRALLGGDNGDDGDGNLDRTVVRAARRLRMVAGAADASVLGAIEPVGRSGVRVVAVGPDGRWVDAMLGTDERARAAASLAGVELREQTDPAFSSAFALGPAAWSPLNGPRNSRVR